MSPPPVAPSVLLALVLAPLLALIPSGCGPAGPDAAPPRSLLVITLDTTRADMLGAYGSQMGVTPNLDRLAERAVLFENAYAPMPQTLPSHATIFTGLNPRVHGALENTYVLQPHVTTLAELASSRGYRTGGFIGALAIEAATGINQGFETWDQPAGVWGNDKKGHPPQRDANEVTAAALAWADGLSSDEPFMLWAHYYDPHGDEGGGFRPPGRQYRAVDPGPVRKLVEAHANSFTGPHDIDLLTDFWRGYLAELRFTDEQLGVLLEGLEQRGLLENTVIAVIGDHGEGLWEHGQKAHGTHLWEEMLRVPLLLISPDGTGAGTRVAQRVMLQDVEPTLRHMVFGELARGHDAMLGQDLWQPVLEQREPAARPVIVERPHYDRKRIEWRGHGKLQYGFFTAVLLDHWKLLLDPDGSAQLFDLEADPDELVDVAAAHPELTGELSERLTAWMAANPTGLPGEDVELSDERAEHLRQLGYLK